MNFNKRNNTCSSKCWTDHETLFRELASTLRDFFKRLSKLWDFQGNKNWWKFLFNKPLRNTPVPMPPITTGSEVPTTPPTTEGVGGPWGAMLGRYRHAKPSAAMSNSTNAGVTEAPCILASLGVVMETRHLMRVSGTGRPADCSLRSVSIVASFSSMPTDQLMMSGSCQGRELWSWYSSSTERQLSGEPRRRKSL